MCELLGVSTSKPIRLTLSWDRFVQRGSVHQGNPDGWGVGLYSGHDALVIREPYPAADSVTARFMQNNAPPSTTILSHVRRATRGVVSLANTQPFVRRLGGRAHLFAHNGFVAYPGNTVDGFWGYPLGETDSEQIFCRLLAEIEPLWQGEQPPELAAKFDAVCRMAELFRESGAANFLYSDGTTLFAHGHRHTLPGDFISTEPGLYTLRCHRATAPRPGQPCEGIGAVGACERMIIIATQPLDDQDWAAIPSGEVQCFEDGRRLLP